MSYKAPRRRTSALAGGRVSNMPSTIPEHPPYSPHAPSRSATERDYSSLQADRDYDYDYDYDYSKERRQEQYYTQQTEPATSSFWASVKAFYPGTGTSFLQQARLALSFIVGAVFAVVLVRFGEGILAWIQPLAHEWQNAEYGTIAFAGLVAIACNPLLFGHSSLSVLGGFIYGTTKGWLLVSLATIIGSSLAFLFSRHVSPALVRRMAAHDPRLRKFLALPYNGIRDVVIARFSLVPHQLINGAIATISDIPLTKFALGSTIASMRPLVHVFVGSRLAHIARGLMGIEKMDSSAKLMNWLSIVGVVAIGVATGIYIQFFVVTSSEDVGENGVRVLHSGDDDQDFDRQNFAAYPGEESHRFVFPQRGPNTTFTSTLSPPT